MHGGDIITEDEIKDVAFHDARFIGSGYPWVVAKQSTLHAFLQICSDVRRVCAGLLDLVSALLLLGALGHRADCVHTTHHLLRVLPSPPHTWYVQSALGIPICNNIVIVCCIFAVVGRLSF